MINTQIFFSLGDEGLVRPGGQVPGDAREGLERRRGVQEEDDGAIPEDRPSSGGRIPG